MLFKTARQFNTHVRKQNRKFQIFMFDISQYNNEVFLRVTNHTGHAEKNLLGPAGIRTRDLRFTSPMLYQLSYRSSWELVAK